MATQNNKLRDNDPHQTQQIDFYPNSSAAYAWTDGKKKEIEEDIVICAERSLSFSPLSPFLRTYKWKIIETVAQTTTISAHKNMYL